MNESNPLITVIIICYNQVEFIPDALNSVLNQTYQHVQIIVADDHSTDGSVKLWEELSSKYGFIFLSSEINIGLNNNILRTLPFVKGEYVSILASDDFIALNKLEIQSSYLIQNGDDGVYAKGFTKFGNEEKLIELNPVFATNNRKRILDYVYRYDVGAPLLQSGLFRKELVSNLVQFWKDYKSDDWVFLIKAYELYTIGFIDLPLFYYRLHHSNSHKNYWTTLPMRLDVASRLVPQEYKILTFANIMISHGHYLLADKKYKSATKFYISSLFLNFSFKKVLSIIKNIVAVIKKK